MNKFRLFITKHRLLSVVIVLVALMAFFGIKSYLDRPQDMGPGLQYIGTTKAGCEWWEAPFFAFLCAEPNYTHYFATDMTQEELKAYFKEAEYEHNDNLGGHLAQTGLLNL